MFGSTSKSRERSPAKRGWVGGLATGISHRHQPPFPRPAAFSEREKAGRYVVFSNGGW